MVLIGVVFAAVAVTALVFSCLVYFDGKTTKGAKGAAGADGAAGAAGAAGVAATQPVTPTYDAALERVALIVVEGVDTAVLGTMFTDGDAFNLNGTITTTIPSSFELGDSDAERVYRCVLYMAPSGTMASQPGIFTVTESTVTVTMKMGGENNLGLSEEVLGGVDGTGGLRFVADFTVPAGVSTITPFFQLTSGYPGGLFVYLQLKMYQIA